MLRSAALCLSLLTSSTMAFAITPAFVEYAGCQEQDSVTIDAPEVVIQTQGSSYDPACVTVRPGTKVTIAAMERHPLQAAKDFGGVVNVFRSPADGFFEDQFRILTETGYYGYFCTRHGDIQTGGSMGGTIRVLEAN